METNFKPGQKVLFNGGFPGVVVRYYSEGMIEVRGDRGMVCIPEEDAQPMPSAEDADYFLGELQARRRS